MQEYISRNIDKELIAWKDDSMRKPLLLRGARQVGKSSAVRHFGKEFKYFAEVNFERHKAIKTFFQGDIDVHMITQKISNYIKVPMIAGKTLLFFDENRVGGKRSSFSPTFVFRPLTPPYVRFRIRRFLFWIPFEIRLH